MRKKYLYSQFRWSKLPRIWTKYLDLLQVSAFSPNEQKNRPEKTLNTKTFCEVILTLNLIHVKGFLQVLIQQMITKN